MDDDFSVALGLENMPFAQKKGAQFTEVVNLSVEHNPDSAVLVGKRLVAGIKVDD